jgi:single-stranded DNA-binding protein
VDLNLIVIAGRVAAQPELRTFESGTALMRLLVTVRSKSPRARVDVIPVSVWDPDPDLCDGSIATGTSVWIAGAVQRRFWSATDGRRSRLEVIAHDVAIRADDEATEERDGRLAGY